MKLEGNSSAIATAMTVCLMFESSGAAYRNLTRLSGCVTVSARESGPSG